AAKMASAIAVLNAGSSSIKFSLFLEGGGDLALDSRGQIESIYTSPHFVAKGPDGAVRAEKSWGEGAQLGHEAALRHLVGYLKGELAGDQLIGVGHRVVHGGMEYGAPVRVDAGVIAALEKYVPLAPLHQPRNLAPIRGILAVLPDLPQVACFDTAFHRTNPD